MTADVIPFRTSRTHPAPGHPSLRWIAGDAYWLAHRRGPDGRPRCGATGELVLAAPSVPLCTDCVPAAAGTGT